MMEMAALKTDRADVCRISMIVSAAHCTDQPVRALGIRIVNERILAMNNPKSRCFQFGGGEIRGQHVVSDLLVARALGCAVGPVIHYHQVATWLERSEERRVGKEWR